MFTIVTGAAIAHKILIIPNLGSGTRWIIPFNRYNAKGLKRFHNLEY